MPRPPKWNSPTDSVRLPKHAIPAAMALAKQLDNAAAARRLVSNVQNPPGPYLVTMEDGSRTESYLIDSDPETPPETWAQADRLVDQLVTQHDYATLLYIVGRMAQAWGTPVELGGADV
jgi:hypothetical protein